MTRPIVTVLFAEATAPVVLAQTPPLLRAWREAGRRVDAAVFTSPRALFLPGARAAHRSALRKIEDATQRAPWRRTHLPRDAGFPGLGASLAKALRERDDDDAILLCRQPRAAIIGIAARDRLATQGRRATVVLDLRGLRDDEYLLTLGKTDAELTAAERKRFDTYRAQEAAACRGADGVLCVSRPMMRAVRQRYGLPDDRLGRAPNHTSRVEAPEDLRVAVRDELRVAPDALLFIYSGTMAAWQRPAESALLVNALRLHRPDVRLLFLTPEIAAARKAVAQTGLDGVLYRSAKQSDVHRYLCAADYGLLLREESMVNRVACPVKFGEYLACGVRPVMTPHIGDQSDLAAEKGLGVVVGMGDVVSAAKQISLDIARPGTLDADGRARRRTWAAENISAEIVAARIAEFADAVAAARDGRAR